MILITGYRFGRYFLLEEITPLATGTWCRVIGGKTFDLGIGDECFVTDAGYCITMEDVNKRNAVLL